jgi:hypothetical protein
MARIALDEADSAELQVKMFTGREQYVAPKRWALEVDAHVAVEDDRTDEQLEADIRWRIAVIGLMTYPEDRRLG